MRMLVVLLLAIVAVPAAAAFDFKGIELGTAVSIVDVNKALGTVCRSKESECAGAVTIASRPAFVRIRRAPSGHIVWMRVAVRSKFFSDVEGACITKFGKPESRTVSEVRNGVGLAFENIVYVWSEADGDEVTLSLYGENISDSHLIFVTRAYREGEAAEKRSRSGDI